MGNVESQNGDHAFYGTQHGHLSRKHMSRSLRVSNKHHQSQSSKVDHRNSETSTRSSSTPSIPQSLVDHALEPFNQTNVLSDYSSPIWVDRVAMNLRPVSCHTHLDNPSETLHQDAESPGTRPHEPQGLQDRGLGLYSNTGEATYLQKTRDGPREPREVVSFKKKRSKSADMWREDDSLDFSLSDLSQEHLTSTEEIIDTEEVEDFPDCDGLLGLMSPEGLESLDAAGRANSLDQLYGGQKTPTRRPAGRYAKWHHDANRSAREGDKMVSPEEEDDGNSYGAYTLPCRRSHCLSEGLTNPRAATCATMQGRRAQTIQDVTAGEGSEYEDSGIDGLTASGVEHQSRRYKTMSMSFSVCSAAGRSLFAGSDSGSSSGGGASEGVQGVYENFRQELEMSSCQTESLEEAGSALSDEQSTMSSAYQSDPLHGVVQGTVRKAGRLAVKNFLVHKKSKKVESATRRKWKSYWVCLKGCTLFFYETDGRSGIDHNSVPKHAAWAENSIVQAVPEHPKKDFVFCLSNSLGDAFLFQTCSQTELENWITAIHSACAAAVARQHHREDTVRLLRAEIKKLEQKIDMDEKMKKMGDMQLSAVTDTKKRKTILDQIFLWEQNLEQFHMGLFRFRCYLASLQGGELPNPKRLLAFASRPTKLAMGRLGIFSVSSFHALTSLVILLPRSEDSLNREQSLGASLLPSIWKDSLNRGTSLLGLNNVFLSLQKSHEGKSLPQVNSDSHMTDSDIWVPDHLTPSWVCLPNDQPVLAIVQPGESALYTLETICKAHQLDSTKHYLRLKFLMDNQVQFYIPKPDEQLCDLSTEQVAAFCRSLHDMNPSECATTSSSPSLDSPFRPPATGTASRQLSDADKLRKVICELVETERTYVKDLNCLIGRYLTPLQKETCLTQDELDILVGNLPEMVEFQVEFLKTLEDGTRLVPDLEKLERVDQFKKILFSLGGSFLYYADRFKIYSAFCASHTKVPKVLVKAKTDADFKAFLEERNPKQQHSSTLESYLIKPIQRVLKYPLLLRELYSLTDPDSEEHYHLNVAMKAMNKVASHINEMQKIHEEFGLVFDQLIAEQSGDKKEVADLSMGDLLLHTSVAWINPPSSLGKWKKEPQLAAFIFRTAAVFVCKDGSKQKKKMVSSVITCVRAIADGEGSAVCEIVHVKSESEGRPERTFHLCCSSVDSKKDFLKTVHSILRDKQRRQLMKTESLPPNQQYVPFGGKRLCALKGARPAMNRAASDPARTLGRRKLVRNRFTIDTDIQAGDTDRGVEEQAGDTDRGVEEQIDLERYEAQQEKEVKGGGDVKETEIFSDDFCLSVRGPSTESLSNTDLDGPIGALSLGEEGQERGPKHPQPQGAMGTTTPGMRLSHLGKQRGLAGMSVDDQGGREEGEDIWLRRENCPPDSGGQTLQMCLTTQTERFI
uniref:TIAM Rac1 associated GEF 1 n=1 Tax=Oncorhynchus kisutch TaxID=8019 RepID=A0A8C7FZE3_ONCKI